MLGYFSLLYLSFFGALFSVSKCISIIYESGDLGQWELNLEYDSPLSVNI